jgi:hypothetical protein
MKNSFLYQLGRFTGSVFFFFINGYAFYDAYLNIKAGKSCASDLALIFAFAAWRKVTVLGIYLKELYLAKEWENDLYRSNFQSDN